MLPGGGGGAEEGLGLGEATELREDWLADPAGEYATTAAGPDQPLLEDEKLPEEDRTVPVEPVYMVTVTVV